LAISNSSSGNLISSINSNLLTSRHTFIKRPFFGQNILIY
jgi:hypothetical protein